MLERRSRNERKKQRDAMIQIHYTALVAVTSEPSLVHTNPSRNCGGRSSLT